MHQWLPLVKPFKIRQTSCEADGFPVGAGAEGCMAHDDVGA